LRDTTHAGHIHGPVGSILPQGAAPVHSKPLNPKRDFLAPADSTISPNDASWLAPSRRKRREFAPNLRVAMRRSVELTIGEQWASSAPPAPDSIRGEAFVPPAHPGDQHDSHRAAAAPADVL
jgi:hypothetical protein